VARIPRTNNPPPVRDKWWWLFRAPGSAAIWLAYMYPGRGKVLASGRRFRQPFIEVVYTLAIYAFVLPILYIAIRIAWYLYTTSPSIR
jgi:hypothetical protein